MIKGVGSLLINKAGAIVPIIQVIFILTILIGTTTIGILSLPKFTEHQVLLSGGTVTECNDGIDNDGDGNFDSRPPPSCYIPPFPCDDECKNHGFAWDDECPEDKAAFRMTNYTNAHASWPTPITDLTVSYPYSACFQGDAQNNQDDGPVCRCLNASGYEKPCNEPDIPPEAEPINIVIRLNTTSIEMSGHAEKKDQNNPNYTDLCFAENPFDCFYEEGSCSAGRQCMASIKAIDPTNNNTNLHVGNCSAYLEKICCVSAALATVGAPGRSGGQFDLRSDIGGIQRTPGPIGVFPTEYVSSDVTDYRWSVSINGGPETIITSGSDFPPSIEHQLTGVNNKFVFWLTTNSPTKGPRSSPTGSVYTIPPADCGNGLFEPPPWSDNEECDNDIATNPEMPPESGDGCSDTCTVEPGWICINEIEQPSQCFLADCGDDICESGENHINCPQDCTWCGDGLIQWPNLEQGYYEECDNGLTGICTCHESDPSCTPPIAQVPCADDSYCQALNPGTYCGLFATGGDGCDSMCQIEDGWDCTGEPSVCNPICGDRILIPLFEGCDDGGRCGGPGGEICSITNPEEDCNPYGTPCIALENDGCDLSCEIEDGWDCTTPGEQCNEYCGDNMAVGSEVCDGTDLGGETCESQGYTSGGTLHCSSNCVGFMHYDCISGTCGNGDVEAPEECDPPGIKVSCTQGGYVGNQTCNSTCMWGDCITGFCGDGRCEYPPETSSTCPGDCGTCFVGDTEIITPQGNVEIQDLKVGDLVMSRNIETENIEQTKIVRVEELTTEEYLVINEGLKVTANHEMFINGEWQEIGKAKIGDKLSSSTDKEVEIYSIETVKENVPVYNIELGKNHNYFARGLMAHNDGGGTKEIDNSGLSKYPPALDNNDDVIVSDKKLKKKVSIEQETIRKISEIGLSPSKHPLDIFPNINSFVENIIKKLKSLF